MIPALIRKPYKTYENTNRVRLNSTPYHTKSLNFDKTSHCTTQHVHTTITQHHKATTKHHKKPQHKQNYHKKKQKKTQKTSKKTPNLSKTTTKLPQNYHKTPQKPYCSLITLCIFSSRNLSGRVIVATVFLPLFSPTEHEISI